MIYFVVGFLYTLLVKSVDSSGQSCQDIDPDACSAMGKQNNNLCMDPTLATSICPKYCHRCPTTCYYCNSTTYDVRTCNTITCSNNEICMVKEIHSMMTGEHMFSLGCASKPACDGWRRSIDVRSFSAECCSDDLCNTPALMTRTTLTPTTTSATATTSQWPKCARDVLFLVDQSAEFSPHFESVRSFLETIIGHMTVGTELNETSVAFATFDVSSHLQWRFNEHRSQASLLAAIQQWQPHRVLTQQDLYYALVSLTNADIFQIQSGNRPNITDVLCIITGPRNNSYPENVVNNPDSSFRQHFSNVIVIGLNLNISYHNHVATIATQPDNVLFVHDYFDLGIAYFARKVSSLVCM